MKKTDIKFYSFPPSVVPSLKRAAATVLKAKQKTNSVQISITMISDAEIKKLNRKYRNVNRITDVISFRLSKTPLWGDIYISNHRSKKQAKRVGNTWQEELCYLVMHGTLHLFDYTDYTPKERKKMFAIQDRLFKKFVQSTINS